MEKTLRRLLFVIVAIAMMAVPVCAEEVSKGTAVMTSTISADELVVQINNQKLNASVPIYYVQKRSNLSSDAKVIYDWVTGRMNNSSATTCKKKIVWSYSRIQSAITSAYYALNDQYFMYYATVPLDAFIYTYTETGAYAYTILQLNNKRAKSSHKRSVENKAKVASMTKNLLSDVTGTSAKSDRIRVLRIRNYVCNKLSYDINSVGTVDSSIRTKYAKCSGYAALFQAMCQAAGITCQQVTGDAGGGHDWNHVKIGSAWYWIDPTWYDTSGRDSTWSLKSGTVWSGRTVWAYLYTINFRSRGYTSSMFD